MSFVIKPITFSATLPIRQEVMWPNKPRAYIQLSNDEAGRHFGVFVDEKLVSVLSLFENNNEVQFRKFATLNAYQGYGYGTALLNFAIAYIEEKRYNKVWCNARMDKIDFYHKFGLKTTEINFKKGGITYVIMEKTF